VEIYAEVGCGEDVTPVGEDVKKGQFLIAAGEKIGPGEMAILATFGYKTVEVYQKPRVGVFATGDELLDIDEELVAGKIKNSNSYMLAAQIASAGAIPYLFGKVPDSLPEAREKIFQAFDEVDVLITTGGVSVGDFDVMVDIFSHFKGELLFNKLAMRPGSPTTAGVMDGKFLFGLSGNPAACFVGFELFVRPVILGMQGKKHDELLLPEFSAILGEDFPKGNNYLRFIRGKTTQKGTQLFVIPVGDQKSSIITNLKDADCLIAIPAGEHGLQKGETVTALRLPYHD
jgi:molybdopterin molybdotransferase